MSLPYFAAVIDAIVCQRSPVAMRDGVDVLAREHIETVAVLRAVAVAVVLVRDPFDRFAPRLADIADRDELNLGLTQEITEHASAATADAETREHDAFAGRDSAVLAEEFAGNDPRRRQRGARRSRLLEHLSSRQLS